MNDQLDFVALRRDCRPREMEPSRHFLIMKLCLLADRKEDPAPLPLPRKESKELPETAAATHTCAYVHTFVMDDGWERLVEVIIGTALLPGARRTSSSHTKHPVFALAFPLMPMKLPPWRGCPLTGPLPRCGL